MQGIRRTFLENPRIELGRDQCTNDVILGQPARHVMVHAGGRIDERLIKQVTGANPRTLKPRPTPGQLVQFEPSEVRSCGRDEDIR